VAVAAAVAATPELPGHKDWVSAVDLEAASRYRQDVLLSPPRRRAVPAAHYVIDPEPRDMRAARDKVRACSHTHPGSTHVHPYPQAA
jgi:hypothetical protein